MAAPIFQRTIVDGNGNVESGATVEVRNEATNELAPIYVDRELTEVKANPFTTDENGLAQFFVARGEYKVTATSGDGAIAWRYVQMLDTAYLVSVDTTQTLTNKTINGPDNTLTNIANASLSNSSVTIGTTTIALGATGNLVAGDIPNLDASKITSGVIDSARLPSYVDDVLEFANLASFPDPGETGKIYIALDTNKVYRWSGSVYVYITSGAVDSVAGKTGIVTLDKNDVGLSNVDNTADSAKNVATAAALTTARTIGGVSFDGTANIDLPGVNITGNQDTTGVSANVTGTVVVANGGTGATSLTANSLIVGNGTSAVTFIAPGTSQNVLTSNGTSWVSAPSASSGGFDSGTAMMFVQTVAPTGWTKSTTHDNKALRVVSGTAGSGGSAAFTTAFGTPSVSGSLSGTVGATTLTTAQMPSHSHSSYGQDTGNTNYRTIGTGSTTTVRGSTTSTGGGGSHDHSFSGSLSSATADISVAYVDVIIATKD